MLIAVIGLSMVFGIIGFGTGLCYGKKDCPDNYDLSLLALRLDSYVRENNLLREQLGGKVRSKK